MPTIAAPMFVEVEDESIEFWPLRIFTQAPSHGTQKGVPVPWRRAYRPVVRLWTPPRAPIWLRSFVASSHWAGPGQWTAIIGWRDQDFTILLLRLLYGRSGDGGRIWTVYLLCRHGNRLLAGLDTIEGALGFCQPPRCSACFNARRTNKRESRLQLATLSDKPHTSGTNSSPPLLL